MIQELATARVLSVALPSHYAFVAISVAMFGIGLGGLLVFLLPNAFRADRVDRQAVAYLACFGVAAAVADFAFLHLHVVQALSWAGFVTLSAAYIVLAVPFLCAGLCIAILMTHFARRMATLYAADLLGAALGCGAAVAVLGMVPAPLVPLVVCAVATVAALVLARPRLATVAAALAAGVLLVVGFGSDAFRMRYVKGWQGFYADSEAWNAFSRVSVFTSAVDALGTMSTGRPATRPVPGVRWIDIDGTAWTPMLNWNRTLAPLGFMRDSTIYAAYHLRPRGDVLIIGTGGGRDILAALVFKARSILGIEINPLMRHMVEERYGDYSGHPYTTPPVRVLTGEGRSTLAHLADTFDVLQLSLVDTFAAGAAGGVVFAENYLYTTEAFREYFRHLRPRGLLSVTRLYTPQYPVEIERLAGMARAAWEAEGVRDFPAHLVVVAQGVSATVLAKRTPFTASEVTRVQQLASEKGMRIIHAPGTALSEDAAIAGLLAAPDPAPFYRTQEFRIDPPTDDRPFFFNLLRRRVRDVGQDSFGHLRMWNDAYVLMRLLIAVVSAMAIVFFVGPLLLGARSTLRAADRTTVIPMLLYFVFLGYGFMAIEVPLLQRLMLLIGYPSYALAVGLGSLLFWTGLGSLASGRLGAPARALPRAVGAAVAASLLYAYGFAAVTGRFLAAPMAAKVVVGAVALAPIGLVLGMCYPLGIAIVAARNAGLVPWAWGLNGATSVVATVLAVFIGSRLGFTATLLTGTLAYTVALVAMGTALRFDAARRLTEAPVRRAAAGIPAR